MSKKMLIDARHPEETRVALLTSGKVEDFDFESLSRKPLRGNIYLARVTRVEPSLQAAFVEYGGNRHGFLAFGEIHPDYYQIPVADRDILRAAETLEAELAAKLAAYDKDDVADFDDDSDSDTDSSDDDDGAEAVSESKPDTKADDSNGDDDSKSDGTKRRRRRRRRGRGGSNGDEAKSAADENGAEENGDAASAESVEADNGAEADTAQADEASAEPPATDETPADYAGDDYAEAPEWHGASEDTVDALPADEAAETPAAEGSSADAAAGDAGEDAPSDETPSDDDTPKGSMPLSAKTDPTIAQELPEHKEDDAEAPAADAASETDGDDAEASTDADAVDTAEAAETAETAEAEADAEEEAAAKDGDENADDGEKADDDSADEAASAKDEARARARQEAAEIADLEKRYAEARRERDRLLKNYRIQEVIKRRQIMLVQVVKEERGNKGAALTTYLSLAGRYGVLMPNNSRGGGVSRKISNQSDRRRLRKAIRELEVPQGQGLIIRTAGAKRTKAEIKRDYDYLARLWDTIRDLTLKSVAPCLIYEEASLIKRAIRDLYDKDTSEILVEGEDGYREAKDFMKMLMPSHAKNVQPYRDPVPLYLRHGVEKQLDEMYQPVVTLKSGGYLVIQQTEALISVDVNSGKATKERNVEATALKTNSEAAVELARQCRLRDLAGLIVVDFIDMEENRNNRTVEKKLKDAMKADRARIQIGSISNFGLLEMSRQRRRSGIVDGTTRLCPSCDGAGFVRSVEMAALRILRGLEEKAVSDKSAAITLKTSAEVALYVLNKKRDWLNRMETAYGVEIDIEADPDMHGDAYEIQTSGKARDMDSLRSASVGLGYGDEPTEADTSDETPDKDTAEASSDKENDEARSDDEDGDDRPKRKRRRRRRRKSSDDDTDTAESGDDDQKDASDDKGASEGDDDDADTATKSSDDEDGDDKPKRSRRGRRGGRGRRRGGSKDGDSAEQADDSDAQSDGEATADSGSKADEDGKADASSTHADPDLGTQAGETAEPTEAAAKDNADSPEDTKEEVTAAEASVTADVPDTEAETGKADVQPEAKADEGGPAAVPADEGPQLSAEEIEEEIKRSSHSIHEVAEEEAKPTGPKKSGWWSRAFGGNS